LTAGKQEPVVVVKEEPVEKKPAEIEPVEKKETVDQDESIITEDKIAEQD
jgi:hypothetical protein